MMMLKTVLVALGFLVGGSAYGKGCMMTFDMSAIKQGIRSSCAEISPLSPDFCKPKKVRKGITYKSLASCPDNYIGKCAQESAAVHALVKDLKKMPGAQVKTKGPKNGVYTTYYYAAIDAKDGKVACARGNGKWTEK